MYKKNISSTRTLTETHLVCLALSLFLSWHLNIYQIGSVLRGFFSLFLECAVNNSASVHISIYHSWVLTHQPHRLTFIGTFLILSAFIQHTLVISTIVCSFVCYICISLSLYLLSFWFFWSTSSSLWRQCLCEHFMILCWESIELEVDDRLWKNDWQQNRTVLHWSP